MEEIIIIDGVKVEECSYYNKDNTPYCCEVWDNECEAQNCYYKQLKRLEQERDKYKHALEEIEAELKDDLTCESRECGCDDYGECLECLKETILNIITEAIGE